MKNKTGLLSIFVLAISLFLLAGCMVSADDVGEKPSDVHLVYVAVDGSDLASGDESAPVKTLAAAQNLARKAAGKKTVHVIFKPGIYYIDETVVFTSADSGYKEAPVIWRAENQGEVTISGGRRLALKWKLYKNGIYQASVGADFKTDRLFINGKRIHMARYPNYDPAAQYYNGFSADAFSKKRAERWNDPSGGFIHAMHNSRWGDMHYIITGKDKDGQVTYKGGWQNNRVSKMHKDYRFVENIFEELDAPGEWFCNTKTQTLYVYPPEGVDLNSATVEAVYLRHLFEFKGNSKNPVKFMELENLTLTHTSRTFMDNKEPLLRSDWTTYRGGAIFFDGAEDCIVKDCLLDQLGSNAIFVNKYNRRISILGCEIANAGASAVSFVGDPDSLRSPLFEYYQTQTLDQMDHTPGPKGVDYPADCLVDDCLIYRNGRVEKQTAGVNIAMSSRITVRNCSIYDVPRAGINICDGAFGGHVIEWCDVFDTVKETGDHGSFNSWGRDRYWHPDRSVTAKWVGKFPDMPRRDCIEPIIIRNSRWRCDHGWDIDLDDGSSNYEIYNNLLLSGGLKNREGYFRKVYNNILVANRYRANCWYPDCHTTFKHNIVFEDGHFSPTQMDWKDYPGASDYNFAHHPQLKKVVPATGMTMGVDIDQHSLKGDAGFVCPEKFDYRVKEDSPVLKLGFKNFPMDNFGVRKASFKLKARRPILPGSLQDAALDKSGLGQGKRTANKAKWNGAVIRNLIGLDDISAVGLGDTNGAFVKAVELNSPAAKAGLQAGDVIIGVEKIDVKDVRNFAQLIKNLRKPIAIRIWRNQKEVIVNWNQ